MDPATLRRELRAIVASLLELDAFGDQEHFVRDLGADSMLLSELAVTVERRYRIKFPEERLRGLACLDDAVRVVGELLQAR